MIATGPKFIATGPQSGRPDPHSLQLDGGAAPLGGPRRGADTAVQTTMTARASTVPSASPFSTSRDASHLVGDVGEPTRASPRSHSQSRNMIRKPLDDVDKMTCFVTSEPRHRPVAMNVGQGDPIAVPLQ
jgi:hypothetical protein